MKKNSFLLIIFFVITCCQTFDEAGKVLRNEKITNTDEFLVKKKDPLMMPPNYEEVPKPDSIQKVKKQENIKTILKVPKNNDSSGEENLDIQESIINKIKKKIK